MVAGKVELQGPEAKSATKAFQDALTGKNGSSFCFEPHHALRIKSEGHIYDYLLGYTCNGLVVYRDNTEIAVE